MSQHSEKPSKEAEGGGRVVNRGTVKLPQEDVEAVIANFTAAVQRAMVHASKQGAEIECVSFDVSCGMAAGKSNGRPMMSIDAVALSSLAPHALSRIQFRVQLSQQSEARG
jgi:hypothetical protein